MRHGPHCLPWRPKPSRRSGCASLTSTSTSARTARAAGCCASARSPRAPTARRDDTAPTPHRPRSHLPVPIPPPHAPTCRIDPLPALCHSHPHHHRPADPAPSALCLVQAAFPTGSAASQCVGIGFQIPNTAALNPAVQFSLSYPPCCRTADKTLFVRPREFPLRQSE